MHRLTLLVAVLLAIGCRDAADPSHRNPNNPNFAITTGSRPTLDRFNGTLDGDGMVLAKGFDFTNPEPGSTIVVTFMWVGSSNTIIEVRDRLINFTPVGNTYHLVEYVTGGGISMATYVGTNIQGYPYPATDPNNGDVLVVEAELSEPTTDGGIVISSYSGVHADFAQAVGTHQSTSGTGSGLTTASPGPVAAGAGELVYAISLSNGVVGVEEPSGWAPISVLADAVIKSASAHILQTDSGSVEPRWTWHYNDARTWLASSLSLKPAPGQTLILNGTLSESGSQLSQGFYPTNPYRGDAIIATFLWQGSTNVISSVTDVLSNGTPVGNTYHLVDYVTNGGISMATYVATNVQNFPDPNGENEVLVVEATLSEPVNDGGVLLSAYSGVEPSLVQALGEYKSAADTASSVTTVDPGEIAVQPGAMVYAVTLSDGVVGIEGPPDFTNITTMSDAFLKTDGAYVVRPDSSSSTARPQWTWYFDAPSTWLATVLSLNPR